eukprot:TRINITY_DN27824_c0_g1_i1.p1 TRINITY_DN27824_c0_g1~~TRINITY_DN27824_c0_g1_i1.p1  ORF type:complete len:167 (-),score=21.65 TRINITY_DN27824_c0_g1_i1:2-442(-)
MELQLHIRGCTIRNCGKAGVEAREFGNLLVENSEIHDNYQGAIIWRDAQNVKISNCNIYDNRNEGILAMQDDENYDNFSSVILEGNNIHNNMVGISTAFMRNLEVIDNQLYLNRSWGFPSVTVTLQLWMAMISTGTTAVVVRLCLN